MNSVELSISTKHGLNDDPSNPSCEHDYNCGKNSFCCPQTSTCRCALGYEEINSFPDKEFQCKEIHCKTNVDCLEHFTNVQCLKSKCECDVSHHLDTKTQTCIFTYDQTTIHVLIGVGITLAIIISIVGIVICTFQCRKKPQSTFGNLSPNQLFSSLQSNSESNNQHNYNPFYTNSPTYAHFENPLHQYISTRTASMNQRSSLSPRPSTPPPQYNDRIETFYESEFDDIDLNSAQPPTTNQHRSPFSFKLDFNSM